MSPMLSTKANEYQGQSVRAEGEPSASSAT
jgi:hypothetical protein